MRPARSAPSQTGDCGCSKFLTLLSEGSPPRPIATESGRSDLKIMSSCTSITFKVQRALRLMAMSWWFWDWLEEIRRRRSAATGRGSPLVRSAMVEFMAATPATTSPDSRLGMITEKSTHGGSAPWHCKLKQKTYLRCVGLGRSVNHVVYIRWYLVLR